jgi:hypothetical protein
MSFISYADFLRGGSLRAPLVAYNAVRARAEVGDEGFNFIRRMRTKTPLRVWTCQVAARNAPVMDVDSDQSDAVINQRGLAQAVTALVAEGGANVEIICFPAAAKAKIKLAGFRTTTAPNGDVWLVQDFVTPVVFDDYLKWDSGINRGLHPL